MKKLVIAMVLCLVLFSNVLPIFAATVAENQDAANARVIVFLEAAIKKVDSKTVKISAYWETNQDAASVQVKYELQKYVNGSYQTVQTQTQTKYNTDGDNMSANFTVTESGTYRGYVTVTETEYSGVTNRMGSTSNGTVSM